MSDETKPEEQATEEKTEEEKTEEEKPAGAQWEYKEEFAIVGQMKDVVKKTMEATEMEIAALHRKLERLQYGS